MNRDAMIKHLKSIQFCAIPTVQTMDMGVEYDFVCAEGCGTVFGRIGQWPAYYLSPMDEEVWDRIKSNLLRRKFSIDDLEGTDLYYLAQEYNQFADWRDESFDFYLKQLIDFNTEFFNKPFFCLYDAKNVESNGPLFFEEFEKLRNAFEDQYAMSNVPWEELSDSELEYWYGRLEDEFSEFPLNYYE